MDLGFASIGESGFKFADFSGNAISDISTISGYTALTSDLYKVEYEIFEPQETKEYNNQIQAAFDDPNTPKRTEGNWDYVEVPVRPGDNSQQRYHKIQESIAGMGGDKGRHFRTRRFHVVYNDVTKKFEAHKNIFPSTGLMGILTVPHVLMEGSAADWFGKNWFSGMLNELRWNPLNLGTMYHQNRNNIQHFYKKY